VVWKSRVRWKSSVRFGGEESPWLGSPYPTSGTLLFCFDHCLTRRRAGQGYHGGQGQDERVQLELDAALTGRGE
jgi:hypothetical protein